VALVQTRTQAKHRVTNVLEDTHITRSSVVADLFGVSGRRMLAALIAGEREPHVLAAFAKGSQRRKRSPLEVALTGQFPAPHARLMQGALARMDLLDRQIADLNQQLGDLVAPLTAPREPPTSVPGVETTVARVMLAEIGTEMSRCGADSRLASWAGMCPGHDESGGKRRGGRMRTGHRDLRRVLGPCAWAVRKMPTSLGRTFRRLDVRLGGKKAAMAVGPKILVIV
jgi:transposase